ncbi:CHAP domain-containing protein [Allobranchiibius sp. GilTou73]|uniref:CHAP domain-containing protein n=1 Tax=Allobranchiibius sp. GilTou73 TaxID=2904523 RepID=UPI001F333E0E|nr:CHAP domain-containing protein [Allobranchiibius sp. GilTou73]UIJ35651.1 peptidase inhibitor family I36 protein [Allobranchiibius sp. GilTou73]
MRNLHKTLTLAGVAVAIATPTLACASPAQAASRDGKCNTGEFCLYFNSNEGGSVSDFTGPIADYGATQPSCYVFKGAGNGKGKCVKNNAASVWNRTGKTMRVYFNSNYGGASQSFAAGAKGNLNATLKNNNASHGVPSTSTGAQTPRNDYDGNPRGFAQDNCTAFAAYRIASRLHTPKFNNYWKGVHWGDAGNWDNAARAAGVKVDKTPKVGAIAVNDVHKVGHVAYVNKVYSDGSFDVEEYNWNNKLRYGTRSHVRVNSGQASFQWMLHF